ncbi:MAG: NAD(P)H-binding protein [Streptosporangiales bacterium]|nr:NAD(P)H-binding protein [Streptosporangiales bacterium]
MRKTILVTGGTGVLGRVVVERLLDAGHTVRLASRRERPPGTSSRAEWCTVDYRSGTSLAAAVDGADTVVLCTSSFGADVDRTVVEAAAANGSSHVVYVSIVGVDRVPFAYYRRKLASERMIERSELPWTVLRATQFHDLVRGLFIAGARAPVMPVPAFHVQPIDVSEVGARLAELAVAPPAGRVPDMGGPTIHHFRDLAHRYLEATGRRRRVAALRLPGKTFRRFAAGEHLAPDHAVGTITFEQYLRSAR